MWGKIIMRCGKTGLHCYKRQVVHACEQNADLILTKQIYFEQQMAGSDITGMTSTFINSINS